jgi:hypothetical protein
MALLRGAFSDLFFGTALPVLEGVVMEKYNSKPDMLKMVYNVAGSDRWGEQDTTITGFGLVPTKANNENVTYDDIFQGFDTTYTHTTFALAFRSAKEFIDDERYGILVKASKALGRSMYNTRQIQGASTFNSAFDGTVTGMDGLELCSTAHTLVGGGTEQNELTTAADLSVTSLRSALDTLHDTTDDRGLILDIKARYLLVPNELAWDAEELLKSSLRPDTAENAINAFQMTNLDYMVWSYLTDPDAWFLLSEPEEHNLKWWEREAVNTSSDYDFEADASLTKIRNRFSFGWSDWRGVFGSPGA